MSEIGKKGGIPPKKLYTYIMRQQQEQGKEDDDPPTPGSITAKRDSGIDSSVSGSDMDYPLGTPGGFASPSPYTKHGAHGKVMPSDFPFSPMSDGIGGESDRSSIDSSDLIDNRNRSQSISLPAQRPSLPMQRMYGYRSPNGSIVRPASKQMNMDSQDSHDEDEVGYKIKRCSRSFSYSSRGYRTPQHTMDPPYNSPPNSEFYIDNYGQPMYTNRRMSSEMVNPRTKDSIAPLYIPPGDNVHPQCSPDSTLSPNHPITPRKGKASAGKDAYFDQMVHEHMVHEQDQRMSTMNSVLQTADLHLMELSGTESRDLMNNTMNNSMNGPTPKKRGPNRLGSNDKVSSSSLAKKEEIHPCQVCSDTAAGFHCGAFVCEACKVRSSTGGTRIYIYIYIYIYIHCSLVKTTCLFNIVLRYIVI